MAISEKKNAKYCVKRIYEGLTILNRYCVDIFYIIDSYIISLNG